MIEVLRRVCAGLAVAACLSGCGVKIGQIMSDQVVAKVNCTPCVTIGDTAIGIMKIKKPSVGVWDQ